MRSSSVFMLIVSALFTICASATSTSHTVSFLSDYLSDSVSQTQRKPALQWLGEARWAKTQDRPAVYGRLFASNLQYANEKGYEFDIGFGTEMTYGGLKWDFGLLNNFNISFDNVDEYFWEIYAGVQVNENSAIYITYSDDWETFDGGNNAKITWDQSFSIQPALSWSYQLGYADMYRSRLSNSDYIWWRLGVHYKIDNLQLSLDYHDTDIRKSVDFNDIAQETVAASVSATF